MSGIGKLAFGKSSWFLTVLWTAAVLGTLAWLGEQSYLAFHSLAELFSLIVAAAIFLIVWNVRNTIDNNYLHFLGIAFLFIAVIDLAHMLAYEGMGVFPGYGADLPTQLWIAGRALESLSLLIAPLFLSRRLRRPTVFAVYAAVTVMVLFSTFAWRIFPRCYIEGRGLTQFKISAEYVICLILILALVGLLASRGRFQNSTLLLLSATILTTILSELAFTKYASVYGNFNMIGHLLKIVAVLFIYKAIVETGFRRPYELLYRNLAESEQRYRSFVAASSQVVWTTNSRGEVNFEIPAWQAFTGQTAEQARGFGWMEAIHPDDRARVSAAWTSASDTKGIYEVEYRLRLHDGTWRNILARGVPILTAAGQIQEYVGTCIDITERKRSEKALALAAAENERQRQLLAVTLASIGDAVIVTDIQGKVTFLNGEAEHLTGWTLNDASGRQLKDVFAIMDEYSRENLESPADKVLRIGSVVTLSNHTILIARDGRETAIDDSGAPVRSGDGTVHGVVLVFRDITERRQAEEQLQKAHDELEQKVLERTEELRGANRTLHMISECNEILVRAQNEQELMRDICSIIVNEGGYRMAWVGYSEDNDEKTVRPVASEGIADGYLGSARISWADNEQGRGPTGTCIRTGEICTGRSFLEDPQLEPWRDEALKRGFQSCIALPLKIEGKAFGAITIYAQEPYAFDTGIDLLRELADDLAFGIRSIRIQAERDRARWIAETRAGQLQALAAELVQAEQKERRRLARILHDHLQQLLVAAKMGTSMIHTKAAASDIREMADSVLKMLDESIHASRSLTADLSPPVLHEKGLAAGLEWLGRQMSEKHGLSLDVQCDPAAEPASEQVRVFLFESVRELLLNIVKHARVLRARIRMRMLENSEIQLVVADEGAGFDPAQIGATHSTTGGFGLFSIRERLHYLGGRMQIDSTPGKGSRFTLTAPARLASQTPAQGVAGESSPFAGPKIRVLIADDHIVVRQGLVKLLEEQPDIQVIGETGKGYEAVEMARQHKPDAVLMDIGLPDMSGLDATKLILSSCPETSVIGLSMHEEKDMADSMIRAGAAAYLTKGGATEHLISAIRTSRAQKIIAPPSGV